MERGNNYCGQKGRIDSGGKGEAQVAKGAAAEVGGDGRRVRVQELVHRVKCGVRWIPIDRWDVGVFEVLDELVD